MWRQKSIDERAVEYLHKQKEREAQEEKEQNELLKKRQQEDQKTYYQMCKLGEKYNELGPVLKTESFHL